MKFTFDWLQSYVDLSGLTAEKVADHLTMLGLEVDSIMPLFSELAQLKTGLVESIAKHENADKLTVCQVRIGEEVHQIVCGAPNVRENLKVVVALPGMVLPGDFKIKKTVIRGVASAGMLCSERELGLSQNHDGIMELPGEVKDGESFVEAMQLIDSCIEVDLTPNRSDCASVVGIAREVAGVVQKKLILPVVDAKIEGRSTAFDVKINNPELCPRYAARLFDQVKIEESPWWLRKRLLAVGIRPINNVVDITNFVMLEYGQPLHAFDFTQLVGNKIVVRTPQEEEKEFTTLDGEVRKLQKDNLLICDTERAVAVAGVMGGENSEISEETTTVLLESACFNPVSVRKTAKQMNLSTEASYRFERGVDPRGGVNALERAAQLLSSICGAVERDKGIDEFVGQEELREIFLDVQRANKVLGITLSVDAMKALLEGVGFICTKQNEDTLVITVPSFRVDVHAEADLFEEIARLYGYNLIPTTFPKSNLHYSAQDPNRAIRLRLTWAMPTIGLTQAINYSFIGEKELSWLQFSKEDRRATPVRLLNPLSEEQAVLRTTLLPGLLENVRRNINFQNNSIKLFELGKVFLSNTEREAQKQPEERHILAGVFSGNRFGNSTNGKSCGIAPLHYKEVPIDIYDAKGTVEFVLRTLRLPLQEQGDAVSEKDNSLCWASPLEELAPFSVSQFTLGLYAGKQIIGTLGKISPEVLKCYSIKADVFYFELDCDLLCNLNSVSNRFAPLPIYPSVRRDISLLVKQTVPAGKILAAVRNFKEKLIENVEIFDTFTGGKVPKGCKSVALSVIYRSETKTLTEKNVEKSHNKVVRMLTEKFEGSFRDA